MSLAKSERLGKKEVRASLFFLVALPYLGAKLEDVWERNGGGLTNSENLFGEDSTATNRFTDSDNSSKPLLERIKQQVWTSSNLPTPTSRRCINSGCSPTTLGTCSIRLLTGGRGSRLCESTYEGWGRTMDLGRSLYLRSSRVWYGSR